MTKPDFRVSFKPITEEKIKKKLTAWIGSTFFNKLIFKSGEQIDYNRLKSKKGKKEIDKIITEISDFLCENFEWEAAEATSRNMIVSESDDYKWSYYLLEGNMFKVIEKDAVNLRKNVSKSEYFKDKIILDIFSKDDWVLRDSLCQFFYLVSGLPWSDNIYPARVIRGRPRLLWKLKGGFFPFSKKDKISEQVRSFFGLLYEVDAPPAFLNKLRIGTLLTNEASCQVAFILYCCFLGTIPLKWWVTLSGKETDARKINDTEKDVLLKPNEHIREFLIKKQHLALLSGLTEKHLERNVFRQSKQDKNRVLSFLDIGDFLETVGVKIEKDNYYRFYMPKTLRMGHSDVAEMLKSLKSSESKQKMELERLEKIFRRTMATLEKMFIV